MKKLFLLTATCLCFAGLSAQSMFHAEPTMTLESEAPAPTVQWDQDSHNFGQVPQGTPVKVTFEFTNTGNKPLEIGSVKPSCGCTAADYSREPIQPGERGYVTAEYNAARPGVFNKSVTVRSNAEEGVKLLRLKGEVVPADQFKDSEKAGKIE